MLCHMRVSTCMYLHTYIKQQYHSYLQIVSHTHELSQACNIICVCIRMYTHTRRANIHQLLTNRLSLAYVCWRAQSCLRTFFQGNWISHATRLMRVCILCMYTCHIHVCMHILCVCLHVCMYVCMCTCYIHVCMYIYIYIMYIHTYKLIFASILYIYIYIYIHISL